MSTAEPARCPPRGLRSAGRGHQLSGASIRYALQAMLESSPPPPLIHVSYGLLLAVLTACSCDDENADTGSQTTERAKARSDALFHSPFEACRATPTPASGIRVASWNIKAARKANLERLTSQLREIDADVIALQEVDWNTRRSGQRKQAEELAGALRLHYVFAGAHQWQGGDYGLALLSRFPLVSARRHPLPSTSEPRILLEVEVCVAGKRLVVFNHHADITARARRVDFAKLIPLVASAAGEASVFAADLNEAPHGAGVQSILSAGYVDVFENQDFLTTPTARLDYLLLSPQLLRSLHDTRHWPTHASDHAALSVDLNWP